MANVSVSVPDELKEKMTHFPSINWSVVAREAIAQKIKDLEFLMAFKSKSKLTEEDALRLGAQVNAGLARRFEAYLAEESKKKGKSRGGA